MNEADACRTLVRLNLEAADWDGDKHFYGDAITSREMYFGLSCPLGYRVPPLQGIRPCL